MSYPLISPFGFSIPIRLSCQWLCIVHLSVDKAAELEVQWVGAPVHFSFLYSYFQQKKELKIKIINSSWWWLFPCSWIHSSPSFFLLEFFFALFLSKKEKCPSKPWYLFCESFVLWSLKVKFVIFLPISSGVLTNTGSSFLTVICD